MATPKGYGKHVYAMYRGDEYLMDGTIDEIARKRGCKRSTLSWMLSPTYKKRRMVKRKDGNPRIMIELVRIDDDEDADEDA